MAELEQQALHQAEGASEDATLLFCAVLVSAKIAFQGIRNMLRSSMLSQQLISHSETPVSTD